MVLSASADHGDIKKAYLLGASSYHLKPANSDDLRKQLKLLYDYWMTCEIPQVDTTGKQLATESKGKLGERYDNESSMQESRVKTVYGPASG